MGRFANLAARSGGPDRPHLRMPTSSKAYAQLECPAKRTQKGVDHPIRQWQAMESDQCRLECRGGGTHVVRVGGSGLTHGAGEKNCRHVYDEFDQL